MFSIQNILNEKFLKSSKCHARHTLCIYSTLSTAVVVDCQCRYLTVAFISWWSAPGDSISTEYLLSIYWYLPRVPETERWPDGVWSPPQPGLPASSCQHQHPFCSPCQVSAHLRISALTTTPTLVESNKTTKCVVILLIRILYEVWSMKV